MDSRHYLEAALEEAIDEGDEIEALEIIKLIKRNNSATLTGLNRSDQSFLHLAFKENLSSVIASLWEAAEKDIARLLFQRDDSDCSCFEYALQNDNDEQAIRMLELLNNSDSKQISYVYCLNILSNEGDTCLHAAVKYKRIEVVRFILEKIKDESLESNLVNRQNINGETPFHFAVENANTAILILLRQYRANPFLPNRKAEKPIHFMLQTTRLNQIIVFASLNMKQQDRFLESCQTQSIKDKRWIEVCNNLIEFRKLQRNIMLFCLGNHSGPSSLLNSDMVSYISFLTHTLFLSESDSISKKEFEEQKKSYMSYVKKIQNAFTENSFNSLGIALLNQTDSDETSLLFAENLETLASLTMCVEKTLQELNSLPEITTSAIELVGAIITLSFLLSIGIFAASVYWFVLSVGSSDASIMPIIPTFAIALAGALCVFSGAFLPHVTTDNAWDNQLPSRIANFFREYFSRSYLPNSYKNLLHELKENILEPLQDSIKTEDEKYLSTTPDRVFSLEKSINTQLACEEKQSLHDIKTDIEGLLTILRRIQQDMLKSRNPFTLFYQPKIVETRIPMKEVPSERQALMLIRK